jgi:aminoglycoside 3'-phosphotransferase II
MPSRLARTPILIGKSGATVCRVLGNDGSAWIEKCGPALELSLEAAVIEWCAGRLPVPKVLAVDGDVLSLSALPGVNLTEASRDCAVAVTAEALRRIHAIPVKDCPFQAGWSDRLSQAEDRVRAGLVDESDFDEVNSGRSAADILAELQSQPPPPAFTCFTHGDACLPNFLTHGGQLSGIVDLGRAGIAHPAQDWALALRSMHDHFGADAECLLRKRLPAHCADEDVLRRFRLLDELF